MIINPIYINGIGSISIQKPLSEDGIFNPVSYDTPRVSCIEPNYRDFFTPAVSRRISKIIKRSIITAKHAISESGIEMPDAIITGTGLGCIEDTEKFLDSMIRNEEKFLKPSFFIQSTHNSISSQIAINLDCKSYNNTYIHRGVSFENALVDAALLFKQKKIDSALVTGSDQMTPNYFTLLKRIGYWADTVNDTLQFVRNTKTKGSFSGEGSISFMLSSQQNKNSYALIKAMDLFYKPTVPIEQKIEQFIQAQGLNIEDIDIYLTGMSGDAQNDKVYTDIGKNLFLSEKTAFYKNICGEFYTSAAYGLNVAASSLKKGIFPAHCLQDGKERKNTTHILFHNHFKNKDHSLILLNKCSN